MPGGRDISSRAVVTPLGERVGKYECGLPPSPRDGNQDVVYCAARRETGHLLISWTIYLAHLVHQARRAPEMSYSERLQRNVWVFIR